MAHAPFISCAHARYVTARFSKNAVHTPQSERTRAHAQRSRLTSSCGSRAISNTHAQSASGEGIMYVHNIFM